jgi:tetratricopeptide (TPR) repeat protein
LSDIAAAARAAAEGVAAYGRGDFAGAVRAFEAAVDAGADSADLWYDLGNALFRSGRPGHAALAWERALRRDPGDEDARANLAALRSTSADAAVAGEEPSLARLGARLDADVLAAALLGSWTLACAAVLVRGLVAGRSARSLLALAALILAAIAAVLGGGTALALRARNADEAVVIAAAAPAREAPEDAAPASFELHAGTKVRVAGTTGAFVRVRLPSGLDGFVEARHLERIAR